MPGARIASVEAGSAAYDAGFEPGCFVTHVDGNPIRDILDWRWHADGCEIEVSYIDLDGEAGTVVLERFPDEDWGFEFDGAIFDDVHLCRNACTFCFMRQLPPQMRSTLSLRDDDFRLSFLQGTFVTLTNVSDEDVVRIVEQHISPLRMSLHAVDPDVRERLIGRHAQAGIENLERLLDAGIEFDTQIVLVPGVNDGSVLEETLNWAYAQPGIATVGIVPLGYTRFQDDFDKSFDVPADALAVIEQIRPYQERAKAERGHPWVYAADEFYRNAYFERVLDELPDESFYGDFQMYEDGIGIIRSAVDDFHAAMESGAAQRCADALAKSGKTAIFVSGEAMHPYIGQLIADSPLDGLLQAMPAQNVFFGGNVNVTGLLTGSDIVRAIRDAHTDVDTDTDADAHTEDAIFLVPSIVFNADGVTLDDMTLEDIRAELGANIGRRVHVVGSNPLDYMEQIADIAGA